MISNRQASLQTLVFLLAITMVATIFPSRVSAQDEYDREFYCRKEGRFLSNEDFLEAAFAYEISKNKLPERIQSLGISAIRELDPGCCSVIRADNPFLENRSWIERRLFSPWVLVLIEYDLKPFPGRPNASYHVSICGEVR